MAKRITPESPKFNPSRSDEATATPPKPRAPSSSGGSNPAPNYETGYGQPPKAHRFRPGRSGNPAGRPKRKQSPEAAAEEALRELVTVTEKGKRKRMPALKLMMRQCRTAAIRGHLASAKFLLSQLPKDQKPYDEYDRTLLSDEELEQVERILSKAVRS